MRDDNDNAPRVTGLQKEQRSREYVGRAVCEQERTLCVSFQEAPDAHVAQVLATDGDQYGSSNAHLSYSLVSVTPIRHRLVCFSLILIPIPISRIESGRFQCFALIHSYGTVMCSRGGAVGERATQIRSNPNPCHPLISKLSSFH